MGLLARLDRRRRPHRPRRNEAALFHNGVKRLKRLPLDRRPPLSARPPHHESRPGQRAGPRPILLGKLRRRLDRRLLSLGPWPALVRVRRQARRLILQHGEAAARRRDGTHAWPPYP
ncbi:hypothetical protein CDD83_11203 [Cordyceps sp. RAO-2017]|nr:hypothetical protein CDD83_11203 [Cordyceps sp. RAO-2017]